MGSHIDTDSGDIVAVKGTEGNEHIFASATDYGEVGTPPQTLPFMALSVGSGGTVEVRKIAGGTVVPFHELPPGSVLAVRGAVVESGPADMTWMTW